MRRMSFLQVTPVVVAIQLGIFVVVFVNPWCPVCKTIILSIPDIV